MGLDSIQFDSQWFRSFQCCLICCMLVIDSAWANSYFVWSDLSLSHLIKFGLVQSWFDFIWIDEMWSAVILFDLTQCDSTRFDLGVTRCWLGPIWFDFGVTRCWFGLIWFGLFRWMRLDSVQVDSLWFRLIQCCFICCMLVIDSAWTVFGLVWFDASLSELIQFCLIQSWFDFDSVLVLVQLNWVSFL